MGFGHNQASGGALPGPVWNRWIQELGSAKRWLWTKLQDDPFSGFEAIA